MNKKLLIFTFVVIGLMIVAVAVNPLLLMVPMVASGLYEPMGHRTPFEEAHERAVKTFVNSRGFGITRMRRAGHWNERSVELDGEEFDPIEIRLVGTTPEFGPRYFTNRNPPRKEFLSEFPFREPTDAESSALERLKTRQSLREELPTEVGTDPNFKRILAPIFASEDCLRCHSVEVGEMLGAFDYLLWPQEDFPRGEETIEESPAAEEEIPATLAEPGSQT